MPYNQNSCENHTEAEGFSMRYVIDRTIGLRSWPRIPFACYVRGQAVPRLLTREEFGLLALCDGKTELPDVTGTTAGEATRARPDACGPSTDDPDGDARSAQAALLARLVAQGLAHPATSGERPDPWSAPRSYHNRLFHSMNWAVTGKCNLNCRHCFMAADSAPMMGSFSWEECLALLDECERCGIQRLTLTGGEPLMHPHFTDLVREISRRGLDLVELNTNGILLTGEMLGELQHLGQDTEIKVSFDGVGHHDWMRGVAGSEEKALAAMRMACDMGFRVRVQTNVHRGNLSVMRATVQTLDAMGVDRVRIIRTTETPRWRSSSCGATLGIVEYYDAMLDLMARLVEDDLDIAVDTWQFAYWTPRAGTYGYHPMQSSCARYRDSTPACRQTRGEVAVSYTGEIYPCNQMSGTLANLGVSLGNVTTTPLHDLLAAGPYYDLVTLPGGAIRAHVGNEPCRTCPYWPACVGGCRAMAFVLSGGDYRRHDPTKCAFFKGGYMAKVDEVLSRSPRPYRCVNDVRGLNPAGEPASWDDILAELGAFV